jgi:ribA/ribD-fused uncharacterized protein
MLLPGTTYRTNKKIKVSGFIHFRKPVSGGFEYELPAGEEFKIALDTYPKDNMIHVLLADEKKFEPEIVDRHSLESPLYDGYSVIMPRNEIEKNCELLTDFADAIYFYSPFEEFGAFSNFSSHGFEFENLYYPTVEHFYQSQKFEDRVYAEQVRKANSPKEASELGKSRDHKLKEDWEEMKIDVMRKGVLRKFETHETLKTLLLSTNDKLLIENSPYDNFWGIGRTGEGVNQLGTILMIVREIPKK